MLGSIAVGIVTGIITNLSYDALFQKDEIVQDIHEAYERATDRFQKKYGNQFGNDLNSFLGRQKNIDAVVNSLFYSKKNISVEDIDFRSFNGYDNPTQEAVIDFINFLYEEVHKYHLLDKILTEKVFMEKTGRDQQEIKKGIAQNAKGIEGLKDFFVDALNNSFQKFKGTIGFDIALSNQTINMGSMGLPKSITNAVDRNTNVNSIMQEIKTVTWFHLKGELGSGKTQLLLLLSKMFNGKKVWISLTDYNNEQSIPIINATLASYTNTKPSNNEHSWYRKAISKLNEDDIIIIDDLPNLVLNNAISELIVKIAKECQEKGIKLLTSGGHEIGLKIKQQLGNNLIKSKMVPLFNDREIEKLLQLKGAPQIDLYKLSSWVGVVSKNNPSIVNLIADYLSVENWNITTDVFSKINRGYHLDELMTEIQNILIQKINDEDTKQLLYRLTIINDKFNNRYVQEVSKIEPMIVYPYEKINKLLGNWITKKEENYTVSPLVLKIGELNLDENIKTKIHFKIAELIRENKVLNPVEIMKLIVHLISAKAYNQAAHALINVLHELSEQGVQKDYWGLTLIWKDTPIPKEIDYDLRIMLRTKQLMVCNQLGENTDFIIQELDDLIFNVMHNEDSTLTRTFATFLLAIHYLDKDTLGSIKYLKNALKTYDQKLYNQSGLSIFPEEIIWLTVHRINNHKELSEWIDMLNSLTSEQIEIAKRSDLTKDCCLALANGIWLQEHKKKKVDRNWEKVFLQFQELEQVAVRKDLQLLKVCVWRARILVLAEFLDKIDEAEAFSTNIIDSYQLTKEEEFLIISIIGKQFVLQKKYEKAKIYLQRALNIESEFFHLERIDTLLEMSQCEGLSNKNLASDLIMDALRIVDKQEHFHDIQYAKILGEYSISLWLEGKVEEAFAPLEKATEILLRSEVKNKSEKSIGSILGHVAGYYSSIAKNGLPPEKINNGEIYYAPFRGIFFHENIDLANLFNQKKLVHLTTLLFIYAEAIKNHQAAKKWLYKGFEMIQEFKLQNTIASVHLSHLPAYFILDDKIEEAVDVSFKAYELLHVSVIMDKAGKSDFMLDDINVDEILGSNDEARNAIYLDAIRNSIVPIMVYVCTISIYDPTRADNLIAKVIKVTDKYKGDNTYNKLWDGIRDVFQSVSNPTSNPYRIFKRFDNINEPNKTILQGISYIAATLHCTPEQALDLQIKSILWIDQIFKKDSFAEEKILIPYFKKYWIQRYVKDRESFKNTDIIDEKFKDLIQNDDPSVIKNILKVINVGFNLTIEPNVQSYLSRK